MGRSPRRDLVAGLTVAIVALPLALGFGISSGLGAGAGIATAVVAGVLAALFGGSSLQVSGPTGAMTVVLVPIVAQFGADGVLVVGLLAGVLLVGLAYAGAGRYMRYIPLPVVEGFTVGIAVVIALQQVPAILGIDTSGESGAAGTLAAVTAWLAAPDLAPDRRGGLRRRSHADRRAHPAGLPGLAPRRHRGHGGRGGREPGCRHHRRDPGGSASAFAAHGRCRALRQPAPPGRRGGRPRGAREPHVRDRRRRHERRRTPRLGPRVARAGRREHGDALVRGHPGRRRRSPGRRSTCDPAPAPGSPP